MNRYILSALLAFPLFSSQAFADIAMTAREVGSDVVLSFSGSVNTAAFSNMAAPRDASGIIYPINSFVEFGPANSGTATSGLQYYLGSVTSGPDPRLGPGTPNRPTETSGNFFSVHNSVVALPAGYSSGSQISGSMTFANQTIAGLGIDSSSAPFTWTLENGESVVLSLLAPTAGDSGVTAAMIQQKIKRAKKQLKRALKSGKRAKAKKLRKKLKKLKRSLKGL